MARPFRVRKKGPKARRSSREPMTANRISPRIRRSYDGLLANITNAGDLPRWHVGEVTIPRLSKGLADVQKGSAGDRSGVPGLDLAAAVSLGSLATSAGCEPGDPPIP